MSEDRLSGSRPTVVVVESPTEWQLADAARWRAGVDLSAAEFELVVELHTDHRFETAPNRLWEAFEAGRATTRAGRDAAGDVAVQARRLQLPALLQQWLWR